MEKPSTTGTPPPKAVQYDFPGGRITTTDNITEISSEPRRTNGLSDLSRGLAAELLRLDEDLREEKRQRRFEQSTQFSNSICSSLANLAKEVLADNSDEDPLREELANAIAMADTLAVYVDTRYGTRHPEGIQKILDRLAADRLEAQREVDGPDPDPQFESLQGDFAIQLSRMHAVTEFIERVATDDPGLAIPPDIASIVSHYNGLRNPISTDSPTA